MSDKLSELIESVLGEDYADVVKMADLRDSDEWDSLTFVNLVVSIEKTFKVELNKDEIQMLTSVANIEAILLKRGINAHA